MKNKKRTAYAMDFVSFLLERFDPENIDRIILFGSVARDEASEESDVDIFIDGNKEDESEIKKIKIDFLESKRYKDYWSLKGITNELNIIVGKLDDWKDLKNSIIADGILLYDRFEEMPDNARHMTMFSWENVEPESKRVLLSKRIFGYKAGKKRYDGLLQKQGGERLGKGSILVPLGKDTLFQHLFRKMGIAVRIRKIIEYV